MSALMRDLRDPRWMYAKAVVFLMTGAAASVLILLEAPSLKVALFLAITIWAFARAYYFAFHVVERYIDGTFQYRGLLSLVHHWAVRRDRGVRAERGPASQILRK